VLFLHQRRDPLEARCGVRCPQMGQGLPPQAVVLGRVASLGEEAQTAEK
jgi:hypothetical protein